MKKTLIHSFVIKESAEKVLFQIKLPRNTKRISAIMVTTNGYTLPKRGEVIKEKEIYFSKQKGVAQKTDDSVIQQEVGSLYLSIPERRNVFYSEIVKVPQQQYDQISFVNAILGISNFGTGTAWVEGKKEEFFSIEIDSQSTLIEGFYSNLLTDLDSEYQVNVYLNLEL